MLDIDAGVWNYAGESQLVNGEFRQRLNWEDSNEWQLNIKHYKDPHYVLMDATKSYDIVIWWGDSFDASSAVYATLKKNSGSTLSASRLIFGADSTATEDN